MLPMLRLEETPDRRLYITNTRNLNARSTLQPSSLATTLAVPPNPAPMSMTVLFEGSNPQSLGKNRFRSSVVLMELAFDSLGTPSSLASSPSNIVWMPTWMCSPPHTCGPVCFGNGGDAGVCESGTGWSNPTVVAWIVQDNMCLSGQWSVYSY